MKFKKIMLVTFLLLAILTIGAVSAVEDTNDTITADDSDELSQGLDDETVSIEQTDIQAKETDDDKLTAGAVKDNSTDESVAYVNGTLILTDIDTGDVIRKNITSLAVKSGYTNPVTPEVNDTINETVNQLLSIAKIQSGGRKITLIEQTPYENISKTFIGRFDNRVFALLDENGTDENGTVVDYNPPTNATGKRYFFIYGNYGTQWMLNLTVVVQYASSDRIISFNATGGEGVMENVSVANNTNYTLPECGFTKNYRVFHGWNVGDAIKQPGENITVTDNMVIRTVWKYDGEISSGGSGHASLVDRSVDSSSNYINGILILADVATGDVIVKNITVGPAKSSMTNAASKEVANLTIAALNQLLSIAQTLAGNNTVTIKNQTVSNFTAVSRYDNRSYSWTEYYEGVDGPSPYLIEDGRGFLLIGGDYGTNWEGSVILEAEYSSDVMNVANVKVVLSKNTFTYNAKVQKPTVTVINGLILKEGVDYTLQWSSDSPKKAATYVITVTGTGAYNGTANVTFKINKAANPLKVKAKTVKVKFSKLKKKAQKLKVTKVVKFTKKGQGTLTYKKVKGNKKITINKKNGKVTIKKGLKKGTYKVKIKIKAKGNVNYKASSYKTVTFKIKVY